MNKKLILYYKCGDKWHHELTYHINTILTIRDAYMQAEEYVNRQFKNPTNVHTTYKLLYQTDIQIMTQPEGE